MSGLESAQRKRYLRSEAEKPKPPKTLIAHFIEATSTYNRVRSDTEPRRPLFPPGFFSCPFGSVQHFEPDDGFTVLIKFQCVCSSMGKVDDRALLERFTVVDDDNHTLVGVFSRHFDLRAQGQLAMGCCEGVLLKNLTTSGFVAVEARSVPLARPTSVFDDAGEGSWVGFVFSTLLLEHPAATSSTSPRTADANEALNVIAVLKALLA